LNFVFPRKQHLREQSQSAAAAAIFTAIHPSGNMDSRRKRQMPTSSADNSSTPRTFEKIKEQPRHKEL